MQVVLTIAEGPWGQQRYESLSRMVIWFGAGQTVVIGSDPQVAQLSISRDPELSPHHFQLECDGKQCWLRAYKVNMGPL
jgi:hypothetical protein